MLCCIAGAAGLANAQRVRGTVRDSVSSQPVSGAVLTLVGRDGRTAGRTIADERGRFLIDGPGAATQLRVIRIGYQPRDVPLDGRPVAGELTLAIAMLKLVALPTVRVASQSLCPGDLDRTGALAMWEQARAGLLATIVAREAKPADVRIMRFERTADARTELVASQSVTGMSGRSSRPFIATTSASAFASVGYVQDDATGRTYNAPDADVLLDPSFAETHCFRLVPSDKTHPAQVGLGFVPVPKPEDRPDVAGTLWMSGTALELRTLEFRYTGLEPAALDAGAGGSLHFETMRNGVVLIDRWQLRMPLLVQPAPAPDRGPVRVGGADWVIRGDRRDVTVRAIRESGGFVVAAKWSDGLAWQNPLGVVRGRVVDDRTGARVSGALVWLTGTADSVLTDSTGAFVLEPLIPGRYTLAASDTTLSAFRKPQTRSLLATVRAADTTTALLSIASREATYVEMCKDERPRRETITLLGRVVSGSGLRDLQVHASWQAGYEQTSAGIGISTATFDTGVDGEGRFHLCGVVRERPVRFTVRRGASIVADTTVRFLGSEAGQVVTIRVP